ncbi:McrB family protein [Rufibacter ruber]|uniref:McrB family protein n=1 Tax=Rufibacter ruber TaxID=1783499 RepID=UPI00083426E3|nr:AAA family ATPase [Rufibacter ruber]
MKDLQFILNKDWAKEISNENGFFFQHGQDALKKWLEMDLDEAVKQILSSLSNNYVRLQEEAKSNQELKSILELLFEIISYCDTKAKDKIKFNKYNPNRVLAEAAVRMNHWVEKLLNFKLSPTSVQEGSPKNAFNYLLDPRKNATILSLNHRKLVSENLFAKPYISEAFVDELQSYFSKYNLTTLDADNYTHFLSRIVYDLEDEWKEEVVGLMASDGTGWQDDHIEARNNYEFSITWNSKSPTGGNAILEQLRKAIGDKGYFNFYYSSGGNVNYKATIVDFAKGVDEYNKKKWSSKKVIYFQSDFNQYSDNNKSAKIVFLVDSFEKVNPIPVSSFKFYKASAPIHDNISPLKAEPRIPQRTESSQNISDTSLKVSYQKIMSSPLNQILFGPPGTGKTYHTINRALDICGEATEGIPRKELKSLFDEKVAAGQIVFTTFHQSMSYEDFIEGIKPKTSNEKIIYEVEEGIFKSICNKARPSTGNFEEVIEIFKNEISESDGKTPITIKSKATTFDVTYRGTNVFYIQPHITTKDKPWYPVNILHIRKAFESNSYEGVYNTTYVREIIAFLVQNRGLEKRRDDQQKPYILIIDEINRGNVSQIFGELITLIEEDKRLGREEQLEVTLPYSKEKFGVPANLYILGTMNTADRSVEALDTALRRRFSFEEMPPRPELIKTEGRLSAEGGLLAGIDLEELLSIINNRIEKLLNKDHLIGHSYFMGVADIAGLKAVFQNKINPLLQEYFFGDFGKIGLVLGKEFFEKEGLQDQDTDTLFADFDDYQSSDFSTRPIYRLKNVCVLSDNDFNTAINTLLRK